MGILQSVLGYETGKKENVISARNSYNFNNGEKSERNHHASTHQWQNGNHSILSDQMKHLTVSVPNLRNSSSLAHTTVNYRVQSSAVFIPHDKTSDVKLPSHDQGIPKTYAQVTAGNKAQSKTYDCGSHTASMQPVKKETTPQNVHRQERIGNIGLHSGGKGEEKQREEGLVRIKLRMGRWIKHYCSLHRILLVGEGDFSFSTCLASTFDPASNMIATSLDSQSFLLRNYGNALSNLLELSSRKCKVMHEIDATEMANHPLLGEIKFDRIIFNFPYAGIFKDLPRNLQLGLHKELVSQFLKNAKEMLSESGEIHITHKTNGFHKEWNLVSLASSRRLRLVEVVDFSLVDYPGYNTKYGFGGDSNFDCYPSKTYKFGLY